MYYSYKSSHNSSKNHSKKSSFSQNSSQVINNNNQNNRCSIGYENKNSILKLDLSIGFCQKKPDKYLSNRQYNDCDFKKLHLIKQRAQQKINSIKLGTNCQLTQVSSIEQQDCQKLMNFIIGGYVDNDFNQYLSVKQFNQKKQDFQMLKDIYEQKMKQWLIQKGKKVNSQQQNLQSKRIRSLLSMIYLNQNMNKISRVKIQLHMKNNKMVW